MTKEQKKLEKQAAKYTHSIWSGKKYERPQTVDELAAESMRVLSNNPAIARLMAKMKESR